MGNFVFKNIYKDPFYLLVLLNKLFAKYYSYNKKIYFLFRWKIYHGTFHLLNDSENLKNVIFNLNIICNSEIDSYLDKFSGLHKQTIDHAEKHLSNYYKLLGSNWIKLNELDWHKDYKSGFRWEKGLFYRKYELVNLKNNADVKFPWELSRGHQYLKLGQAYLLTKDEKYAIKFVDDISNWIDENPFMQSINWTCTMEVAIRAVNWIFALGMFDKSNKPSLDFKKKIFTALYLHGYFIYRNPEKNIHNNHNHYISDLAGQIYLGMLFKGIGESDAWLEKGKYEFFREIRYQILPTGVDYERSINYHRLVLEILSYTIIALKKNQIEIPSDILLRVEKMFEFVMHYTKPDGTAPVIGDQDDGRFLPFGENRNIDHRYILSVGAWLFKRDDFKAHSNGFNPECFFLFGPESSGYFINKKDQKFTLSSVGFKDAGFFVMRHQKNYMFINHSGKGRYSEINSGTHTHSDLLSFELYVEDKSFIIDPGTYVYSADPVQRLKFRSTYMHNTVVVDNENQNQLKLNELWSFERDAIPVLREWVSNETEDIFDGEHNGYVRLEQPVIHRRRIIFNKTTTTWEIKDILESRGKHFYEWYFHFDENIGLLIMDNLNVITQSRGSNIRLEFFYNDKIKIEIHKDFISKEYGTIQEANVLKVSVESSGSTELSLKISKI
jgi:hypothetical protein